ncbi:hypothetical protein C1645_822013 [Glomus cerebriforme]|uniref:Uncharacterized protein n=1 Tax=Glomus cerebriforme TaxID=658196 RepID=A0A397SZC3_9GLOM|nr:hypothetical protein C1645_822013 [Glomus cerebriforme]
MLFLLCMGKNGPLCYNFDKKEYMRDSSKKVALKCLSNITEKFLNEVETYSIHSCNITSVYGISQNPDTL